MTNNVHDCAHYGAGKSMPATLLIARLRQQVADAEAAAAYWQQQCLDARVQAEAARIDKEFLSARKEVQA